MVYAMQMKMTFDASCQKIFLRFYENDFHNLSLVRSIILCNTKKTSLNSIMICRYNVQRGITLFYFTNLT